MSNKSVILEVLPFFFPAINFCLLEDIPAKVSSLASVYS